VVKYFDRTYEHLSLKFEAPEFEGLRNKPSPLFLGISEVDAALLKRAFGIDAIAELAENKYVRVAQLVTISASVMELLESWTV